MDFWGVGKRLEKIGRDLPSIWLRYSQKGLQMNLYRHSIVRRDSNRLPVSAAGLAQERKSKSHQEQAL
jgi:hypothetical protein